MRTLRWLDGVLIVGVSYLASAVVVLPLAAVLSLRDVTAVSIVVLTLIAYVWLRAAAGRPMDYVGMGAVSPRVLVLTVLASLAVMVPAMSTEAIVLERFGAPPEVVNALEDLIRARDFPELLYVILVAAVGASASEEFVFRGILQNSLSTRVGGVASLTITAAVFGLLHTPWRFPGAFMLGLFLGFLYMRTGSLVPGLVSHAVINTTSVLLFNIAERSGSGAMPAWMEEDKPAPAWLVIVTAVAFFAIVAALRRETAGGAYPLPHGGAEESANDIA